MKPKTLLCFVAGLDLLAATASTHAHHAFAAEFDAEKPLKMTGTVTRVEISKSR